MRRCARLIAALLSFVLTAEPAFSAGRIVVVPKTSVAAINGAASGALGVQGLNAGVMPAVPATLILPQSPITRLAAEASVLSPESAVVSAPAPASASAAPINAQPGEAPGAQNKKNGFKKKVAAIGREVGEAAESVKRGAPDGGKRAADKAFAALEGGGVRESGEPGEAGFERLLEENLGRWERGELQGSNVGARELLAEDAPLLSSRQLWRAQEAGGAVEDAVTRAMAEIMPGKNIRAVSRGSTSRQTQADGDADYDVMVKMPADLGVAEYEEFMASHAAELKRALEREIGLAVRQVFSDRDARAEAGGYVELSDPATRRVDEGVYMMPVRVYGGDGRLLLDADVTFTNREKYVNAYPEFFQSQIEQVEKIGGEAAKEEVLFGIRLAKKFFNEAVGAYKVWRGGPSGVGVEQMIMQSGRVSGTKGETIEEPGSFDKFIDQIYAAAFTSEGQVRSFKEARGLWVVRNPFREPANFLAHFSEKTFRRLAGVVQAYRRARAEGRPIRFEELRRARGSVSAGRAPAREEEAEIPVREVTEVTLRFKSGVKRARVGRVMRDLRRSISYPLLAARVMPAKSAQEFTVSLAVEGRVEEAELGAEISKKLASMYGEMETSASSPLKAGRMRLFVRPFDGRHAQKAGKSIEKMLRRLERRMDAYGRMRASRYTGAGGEYMVSIDLKRSADAEAALAEAEDFFKRAGAGARLTGATLPEPAAEDVSARRLTAAEQPAGALTVKMLEEFTLTGPKPAERGDAFLYAQGAKVLPPGLEASVDRERRARRATGKGGEIERVMFQRRGTRAAVLMPSVNRNGETRFRPVNVRFELAQGIVSDTLVEVESVDGEIVSVTPIGSYPGDVIIGRVSVRNGEAGLEALFSEEGRSKSLYGRMPVSGDVKDGDIVQAFVKASGGGFSAEALISLGGDVTPEIAAREIALRYGARAYFDEAVIRQAEEVGRTQDVDREFSEITLHMKKYAPNMKFKDMSDEPMVTVDPIGAGDLDDAFSVIKHEDGSYTWYLATADVAQYVAPGTPAFRAAARIGNTFYSIDKNGVPEYPMNHPVVSKNVSSLLAGKASLAMMTRMRFSAAGEFLEDESEVFLAKVKVRGRYTYEQVKDLWGGGAGHGIKHIDQINLARELAGKLNKGDLKRGKMALRFTETAHHETNGEWKTEEVVEDPLLSESHKLIEELKVYGNRGIAALLTKITADYGVPHISRVHPGQDESVNERLKRELAGIGVHWRDDETLWDFLNRVNERTDLTAEGRETAQILALMTRRRAEYSVSDDQGHEGLALGAGQYDHPSTPIRRFADMYNRALLEAYISGHDPRAVYETVLKDLTGMGFESLDEYMKHLNGRESASKAMDREVDNFMSLYELAKPAHRGKTYEAYVKVARGGRFPMAVLQFRDIPVSVVLNGEKAAGLSVLDGVRVSVRGADPEKGKADIQFKKTGPLPAVKG